MLVVLFSQSQMCKAIQLELGSEPEGNLVELYINRRNILINLFDMFDL